jgi:divalent metal cation (Fe/Co/Zn/Cd) transporter
VSLDLEVDGEMTLGVAHEVASRLELAIQGEFDGAVEVDTHIEPLEGREIKGEEDLALSLQVEAHLNRHAGGLKLLRDIHHVRMRRAGEVYYGVFHCRAARDVTVEAVHAEVDVLERAVKTEFPMISRIIGHAEPR